MAKTLPPTNPLERASYNTVVRLTRKLQTGKPLSATEQKQYQRAMTKLKNAGYSIGDINNSVIAKIGSPTGATSFGLQDLTLANPVDTAKDLLEKAKVTGILKFLGQLTDPHTWLRVAFIILGGLFFLVGLGLLLKELGAPRLAKNLPVAKAVAGVAK